MRLRAMVMLSAAGLLVLGGCGGSDDGGQVATAGGASQTSAPAGGDQPVADEQDRLRQFAQCMREHGVDMPDPDPNGGRPKVGVLGAELDKEKVRAALEACREFMPNGGERRELSPEDLEKMRQMAQCMREHGVDVPDPDPNGQGGILIPKGADGKPAENDTLRQALEACRHLGPKAGADG